MKEDSAITQVRLMEEFDLTRKQVQKKVIWIKNYSMIPQKSCGQHTSPCVVYLIILLTLTQLSGCDQERKTGRDTAKQILQNSSLEVNVRLKL